MVANAFELQQTSDTLTMDVINVLFGNEGAIEAYHVCTMSSQMARNGLSINSLAGLDS